MDEWDYSPLILASICGHENVVRLLLEKGSIVSRDTFEGSRAIYGALTDSIRTLLLSYDITKAVDVTQPFASHISALFQKPRFTTADLRIGEFCLNRFLLSSMSSYFQTTEIDLSKYSARSLQFLFEYIYLVPSLDLNAVKLDELRELAQVTNLTYMQIAVDQIVSQKTAADINKAKNIIQHTMYENARQKLKSLVSKIIDHHITKPLDIDLTNADKQKLLRSCNADLVFKVNIGSTSHYYPVHRAILSRAEYYLTLFVSGFHDTAIFEDLEQDGVVDLEKLYMEPELIPVISLPSSDTLEVSQETTEILLQYLYFDEASIPPESAMDTLVIADSLFLDRLKTMAAISLSSIDDFSTVNISVYDILRAAWEFKVHRLEDRVAHIIANQIESFIKDPEFKEVILESSSRISARQEFDTIELIDDIRFHLTKRYAIDQEGGTLDPTMTRVESEEYLERLQEYEHYIEEMDLILQDLGLNA
ncbi:hypothetical protein OGAPHI_001103 [Ogataea philodendri]|uniref:BTB domain-containing protein n=1 Tax=Ogataea philodendri TaxID=1378263 RepID=A0A9P8PE48_9ASCO|nr:uncharacterized protein OGAPHI_001103 [Ogataea philodendri]KAH3670588.1 hypothetical protein OGAPHI_001103 [Ogataea philodendri]